jgi:hypothetical protein
MRCSSYSSSGSLRRGRLIPRIALLFLFFALEPLPAAGFLPLFPHYSESSSSASNNRVTQRSCSLKANSATSQSPRTLQEEHSPDVPHLVFPGGGIFFYWQAGVVSYLREQGYDTQNASVTGASAGALTATLTAAGVDFYRATELALELAARAKVWERGSLQGIWGPLIYEWLDELLPVDAVERVSGLTLLVTPLETMLGRKDRISEFSSREDLIECNMASVHLPWFLDGKLTRNFRNRPHLDGSFLASDSDYYTARQSSARTMPPTLILGHSQDPNYKSRGLFDIVEAMSPDGIWGMLQDGKRYAQYMDETGLLSALSKNNSIAAGRDEIILL